MSSDDRLNRLLAAAAFLAGTLRGWSLPVPTDAAFRLVRLGDAIALRGLAAWTEPPGGEGAPVLGAIVAAIGALFSEGPEDLGRPAGAVLLGACAAALAWGLARRTDRTVALLGVLLLVLNPAFAASFPARPDAAAGGFLLLAALALRTPGEGSARSLALAWSAGLATPAAWPAAAWLQFSLPAHRRRDPRSWIGLLAVIAGVTGLSLALPAGHRLEILRGLFSGWSLSGEGAASTLHTLRRAWALGALPAVPLLLPRWRADLTRPLLVPWFFAFVASAALSKPGVFRETTAALAPVACLLFARVVDAAAPRGRGAEPRRLVLAALAAPLVLLLAGQAETRAWQRELRADAARLAQVADFVRERLRASGALLAEPTGALAALSGREVFALRGASLPRSGSRGEPPGVVVFSKAIRPETRQERALFAKAEFLASYAPLLFRRGPSRAIQDCVWVLRRAPAPVGSASADYPRLLREGWLRHANGDLTGARRAFQAAAGVEPDRLGLAREWLGIVLELEGDGPGAEAVFQEARQRDPTTARARGHLADRALSRGAVGKADSLLAEAFAFTEHDAELWGLRARLIQLAGDPRAAREDSETAIRMNPTNPRLLMNHGILLWQTGEPDVARDFWELASRVDPRVLGHLGDFRSAPDEAPAPPMAPLFSFEGFRPPLEERPGSTRREN